MLHRRQTPITDIEHIKSIVFYSFIARVSETEVMRHYHVQNLKQFSLKLGKARKYHGERYFVSCSSVKWRTSESEIDQFYLTGGGNETEF